MRRVPRRSVPVNPILTHVPFARRSRWRQLVHLLLLLCLSVATAEAAVPDECADGVGVTRAADAPLHPGAQWVVEAVDRDHGPLDELPPASSYPTRDHCSHGHGQGTVLAPPGGTTLAPPPCAPSEQMRVPDGPAPDQRLRPPLG